MQITLPALQCPIASAINPYVRQAECHTDQWLKKFKLLDEDQYEYYRRQGFAYMVARMFPTASPPMLFALTDINSLLFLLDDQIDHQLNGSSGIGQKEFLKSFVEDFISVLAERSPYTQQTNPALAALAEFWERMCNMTSIFWQSQFIHSVQQTFDAALWQLDNISKKKIPTVAEFIKRRNFLGAANIATDSIIAVHGMNGSWGKIHSQVYDLTLLCRNIVCWANDLYSLSKELEHGDIYNLVLLIQHEDDLTLDEAITKAVEKHDRDMREFLLLGDRLVRTHNSKELVLYYASLKHIIRGNVDWSHEETTRYQFSH
ncbi:hypothetical protein [Chitinophaga sp. HK235]|uniref:terpene synthase family protein n=1 Tax=Chitinophaga sp. HK235 TaxID=2952571 RepID=UPI001BAC43B7|nr:hypothetical protein [Chitinophaga sp. HK235]